MKILPRKWLLMAMLTIFPAGGCGHSRKERVQLPELPRACGQVLLVTSEGWEETKGTLRRFQREPSGEWEQVGDAIPVSLGRSGMGWGKGLAVVPGGSSAPLKIEGDGKSPAGIFSLGTSFGYAAGNGKSPYPYRQTTSLDFFVDDVTSPDYNQWVRLPEGSPPAETLWKSFERMRRDDSLYEWGVVVNHNMAPVEPGAGSAIFLHLWSGQGKPTAGCSAMSRDRMKEVIDWLVPDKMPLLVQIPMKELNLIVCLDHEF